MGAGRNGVGSHQEAVENCSRADGGRDEEKSGGASRSPAWGPRKLLGAGGEVVVLPPKSRVERRWEARK